jgi:hypothetical protein
MAKIYVAEYPGLGTTEQGDSVAILALPPTTEYTVIVSAGTSVAAQAILPTTRYVELSTDTTCSYIMGTATSGITVSNCRLNANERVVRRVPTSPQVAGPGSFQLAPLANFIITTSNV